VPAIGETVTLEIDSKRSLCLTLVGVRWSVERRTIFLTPGAETGRLHAARLRIANLGDAVVAAEPASVTIVTEGLSVV
jgi:hypothetical protein